jgi:hypothetical protein
MLTTAFLTRALFTASALWFCLELVAQRVGDECQTAEEPGQKKNFACWGF